MNIHTQKPGCYTDEAKPIDPRWRDEGKWCYMTLAWAEKAERGCLDCTRLREQVEL